jgi:hypothetical protein
LSSLKVLFATFHLFVIFYLLWLIFLRNRRTFERVQGYHFFDRKGKGTPNSDLRPTLSERENLVRSAHFHFRLLRELFPFHGDEFIEFQ